MQQPEPRELVAGVVGEAEEADQILHVRGFEEPQPAVLHVGDTPPRQLELEKIAVVRGAHEHRLLAQRDAFLAMGQDLLAHGVDLRVLVGTAHEPGPFPFGGIRPQARHEPLGRAVTDRVGDVEDRLHRPVVVLEQDRADIGERELDIEEVSRAGSPEAVDGLRVVAHNGETGVGAPERAQHVDLERVHVLVLVDAHVVDLGCEQRAEPFVGCGRAPVEEQVVEVDETEHALAADVRRGRSTRSARADRRTTARPRR